MRNTPTCIVRKRSFRAASLLAATFCLALTSFSASAELTFTVSFTAQALTDLDASEQALFTDGLNFWDDVIVGHRDGVDRTWNLTVDTFSQASSGGGVTLGSAGPSGITVSTVVAGSGITGPFADRFFLSSGGNASFNVSPDAGALQIATIRHEIGHALGIGTLWEDNQVYSDGDSTTGNRTLAGGIVGQYTGAAALAAYQAEFDSDATFIPVELDGGPGTAHGHWNSATDNFRLENAAGFDSDPGDGGPAPTSINGSLDDELLTGVLTGSAFLSNTTVQSLYDIGFEVVPEPSSLAIFALGGMLLARRRRQA